MSLLADGPLVQLDFEDYLGGNSESIGCSDFSCELDVFGYFSTHFW
jgi:hypothetical protein